MARPLRIEYPGALYHVTSRGNEQKDVFKSRRDREQFLSYLESAVVRYGAVIHAYCLMSNHYHLLLETPEGNLSQVMRHINGAYTTYFNIKRKRAGHLFQGRYKALLVEADEYSIELCRYIHLNPVKVGMVAKPEEYEWSSYRQLIGITEPTEWLTTKFILGYFPASSARSSYREFVNDALKREIDSPMKKVIASTILGSPAFIVKMSQQHLGEKQADRNMPAVRVLNRPKIEDIIKAVSMEIRDENLAKKVSLYFCHRYSGARLREIGERFGLSDAAVTQASRRLRVASESDDTLRKRLDEMVVKLRMSAVET
jgi:REP element-mobilizing transposase RayT